jgi:CRP-like cAMP-binding protein
MDALRTDPALAEAFMARLARQLQELRARMELRNIRSARVRVLQYLRLCAGIGESRSTVSFKTSRRKSVSPARCYIGHWRPLKKRDI